MNKSSRTFHHHSEKTHHDVSHDNAFSPTHASQANEGQANEGEQFVKDISQGSSEERDVRSSGGAHHDVPHSNESCHRHSSQAETSHEKEGLREQIQDLERSVEEFKKKWMYAEAENQNVRARAKREVEEARQYAVQKFAKDIVEVAENLQRALESLPQAQEGEDSILTGVREGVKGIERSFLTVLERHGIQCHHSVGSAFDAHLHQAMAEQPSDEHAHGTVIHGTPAWTLHGRLLKPAMVVVSKAK
ncbi:MAG: nucleotide exchange factor GrpE [Acetobacter sp.]|nr:nucleotide exchange factor GrpE [Acetobacter sp.]